MEKLVGRTKEIAILKEAMTSQNAEMIAVIGRRRVGKTFLIKKIYEPQIVFEMSGIQNATTDEQLRNFTNQLRFFAPDSLLSNTPKDWLDAFFMLIDYLKMQDLSQKQVVFFDELPWLANPRSGFLKGLSYFWNSWAANQNIVVVVCGSAASWMINKLVHHTGGLHNRITRRLYLAPFTLRETELYLQSRNIYFERYQIVQLYMAMGGVPHYLKEIRLGKSAVQNIDEICFSKNGLLRDEFLKLYPSLFSNAENHITVIKALAEQKSGLTRSKILQQTKLPEGGTIQRVLEELEQSGFISIYQPFAKKKKDQLYRLTDEYSLFYLQFIEGKALQETETWTKLSQTAIYKTWSGYAFESICLKHISNIKKALGISGIYSEAATFYQKGKDGNQGVQIDLLIDRNDHVINLFEIKFYNVPFILTKDYAKALRQKMALFQHYTGSKKQIFLSMVTTFGIVQNQYSLGLVQHDLTIDDLFE
jgi:AAA+ ATPase superfamily predicted ATPase